MALRIDEQYVYDKVEEWGGMEEIEESVKLIEEYRNTDFYASKNTAIVGWEIDHKNIYDMIISVFTATLTNDYLTYQAMVGMLNHKIKIDDELWRVKIMADIIGLISTTGLIEIESERGEYHQIFTEYDFEDEAIPEDPKHQPIFKHPRRRKTNWDYDDGTGSVILGHRMNHHEDFVRLSHLDRMNKIPLTLDEGFIREYEEAPKKDPVGIEEELQWENYSAKAAETYEKIIAHGNVYYDNYKYCSRGRQYSGSYYAGAQGSSYKKAIVQLRNQEITEGF